MSFSEKPDSKNLRIDPLSSRLRNTDLNSNLNNNVVINKPDKRPNLNLNSNSPVSPLMGRAGPSTSSSSSSSGSVTRKPDSHSGELSVESSPNSSRKAQNVQNSVNVLPAGNICPSGKVLKTGMAKKVSKTDVLGSGTGNYGHGSIMRGLKEKETKDYGQKERDLKDLGLKEVSGEELKRMGNEKYKSGMFLEAVGLYEKAILCNPSNATYRFNKAVALMGLKRVCEAAREFEEAIRLDNDYFKAHQRLGSLFIRLGQVENARRHLYYPGYHSDPNELQKLQLLEKHLTKCTDSRRVGDWKSVLREVESAIATGADSSPQLFACKAEAFLKLHQLEEANTSLSSVLKSEESNSSISPSKFFGMLSVAYLFFVRAQIEMAFGRFENAVSLAEKAGIIDPRNVEVSVLINNVRLASRSRIRGNDLFKSERYTEACAAYSEGLRIDPSNSVLYCNRAACWYKLGRWEHSLDDCNQAMNIQPNYTKALLRRAASNTKLERWEEAVRDYEALRRELPHDNEVAENFFHAQVALKKSRGEEVYNMKFGGEVEVVSGIEQFKAAISSPGVSVVHFKVANNLQCKQISPFLDTLCGRYPSINFLKVDVDQSQSIATAENVRIVPTFKIYKNGNRIKEMVCPSPEVLESSVRHYSL